jgi:hypothetical protein
MTLSGYLDVDIHGYSGTPEKGFTQSRKAAKKKYVYEEILCVLCDLA